MGIPRSSRDAFLSRVWAALGRPAGELAVLRPGGLGGMVPLPAHTAVADLACASVAAASCAAATLAGGASVTLEADQIGAAYASERHLRIDGARPEAFAALSGFFRASDGWVRTHGNYPHHARALCDALGLAAGSGRAELAEVLSGVRARDAAERVTLADGLCVVVGSEDPAHDALLREQPIVRLSRIGDAAARPALGSDPLAPLRGVRVLDLTRVIAGPVGTRTLAFLGADVLRLDPPHLPEIEAQHLDTGHGKRSALLDLRSPAGLARFWDLLGRADVVALGYRATALARLGLSPSALAARAPGIVIAAHTAWTDPDRRGFDSLVQAACGLAVLEGRDDSPGALPAQALDHSTGYLLAAGVMTALARQRQYGGSWLVSTSLRRVAAELLGMPRTAGAPEPAPDHPVSTQTFRVDGHEVTTVAPAVAYDGAPATFDAPRPWGRDEPAWRHDD